MVGLRKTSLALLLLSLSCATVPPRPAPAGAELEAKLLDGASVPWSSLLGSGGGTLVVFATLWCEICRRERPQVEAWARAHQASERTVYVFSGGDPNTALDQIRALHLDTQALTVVVDEDGRLADHYAVQTTPTLLLLGEQGRVLSTHHRVDAIERK
jgi:thiol-disulfide isomerase/thioredoxin